MNNNNRKFIERFPGDPKALYNLKKKMRCAYPLYKSLVYKQTKQTHTHIQPNLIPVTFFFFFSFSFLGWVGGGTFSRGLSGRVIFYGNTINARKNIEKNKQKTGSPAEVADDVHGGIEAAAAATPVDGRF